MKNKDRWLNERIQRELEEIVAKNWAVDGPFVTTLDEMRDKVLAKFGMPELWLRHLVIANALGFLEVIKRKDDEELIRLVTRMFYVGLLMGAEWCNGNSN